MTELEGTELRKAVATALGWVPGTGVDGKTYYYHPAESVATAETLTPFESSLDACFGPDGPIEWLRGAGKNVNIRIWEDGQTDVSSWPPYDFGGSSPIRSSSGSNPAEAICRAFLAAVSSDPVRSAEGGTVNG